MQKTLEILSKIGFDWRIALANLVNFLIVFYLLKKYLFPKLKKVIEERQNKINEGLDNAEYSRARLAEIEKERSEIIFNAKKTAKEIIAKAEADRKVILKRAEADAENMKRAILAKAEREVSARQNEMLKSVYTRASELVVSGVRKILGEEVDTNMNDRIIKAIKND